MEQEVLRYFATTPKTPQSVSLCMISRDLYALKSALINPIAILIRHESLFILVLFVTYFKKNLRSSQVCLLKTPWHRRSPAHQISFMIRQKWKTMINRIRIPLTYHLGHLERSTPIKARTVRIAVRTKTWGSDSGLLPSSDGDQAPPIAIISLLRVPVIGFLQSVSQSK